jgi:PIN domain nuclease of toxin-antitoxin system
VSLLDLPDYIIFSDWINDDMTEEDIKEIVPDLAWELLDLSGMDRDSVDRICYPENFEI